MKTTKPNYKKISKALEEMLYGAAFSCTGDQCSNQLPIIIDAISYFLATADGNAFSCTLDDGKEFHQQYDKSSKEILKLGIEAYMKKYSFDRLKDVHSFILRDSFMRIIDDLNKQEGI